MGGYSSHSHKSLDSISGVRNNMEAEILQQLVTITNILKISLGLVAGVALVNVINFFIALWE